MQVRYADMDVTIDRKTEITHNRLFHCKLAVVTGQPTTATVTTVMTENSYLSNSYR